VPSSAVGTRSLPSCATPRPRAPSPSSRRRRWRRRVRSCAGAAFRSDAPLLVAALRLAAWPAIETEDLLHGLRVQLTRTLHGKLPIWVRLVRSRPRKYNFSSCSCYCFVQLQTRNLATHAHEGN
jgi:hypothetical protein